VAGTTPPVPRHPARPIPVSPLPRKSPVPTLSSIDTIRRSWPFAS